MRRTGRKSVRYYLLVEVMISMALVALCLSPLLRTHAELTAGTENRLAAVLLQREADHLFRKVRQDLYDRRIPWHAMNHGTTRVKTHTLTFDPVTLDLPHGRSRTYEPSGEMKVEDFHRKGRRATYRLLTVTLKLQRSSEVVPFTYQIFVDREHTDEAEETV